MAETDGLSEWVEAFVAWESTPQRVVAWVDRVYSVVVSQNPEIQTDAVLLRLSRATIDSHWRSFLATLKDPQYEVPLVQAGADLATDLASRGIPITVMFHLYRVAQQEVWRYMTSVVDEASEGKVNGTELLVFLWDRVSTWLDAAVVASAAVFRAERNRILRGTVAEQLETVRAILAGKNPDNREIVAILGGYPISGYNTAVLLHTDQYREIGGLNAAAVRLGQVLKVRHPLVVSPGGRDLWCWYGTRSRSDLSALRACESWLAEHQITACAGTPAEGLPGFRLSHQEAQRAEKLAFGAKAPQALTLFPEVELLCLLSSSPEEAQRFVARTLGPLAEPGAGPARLRKTLHALLSVGSVEEAAKDLSVHKNTVRYRTSQAEALMGQPVSAAPTEVELALRYHEMFVGDPLTS